MKDLLERAGTPAELLALEEADAWFEYHDAVRSARLTGDEHRYRQVEPWAWARLSQRLRAIATRRKKLAAA